MLNTRARRFADAAVAAFERAAAEGESRRILRIAGRSVALRIVGPALECRLLPALEHALVDESETPSLTICAWATKGSGVEPPAPAWQTVRLTPRGDLGAGTGGVNVAYAMGSGTLSVLDTEAGTGVFWVRDADELPPWESAAPFRNILGWWAAQLGGQLVHGAAVSENGRAVLLAGRGGSGKSSTALTCLLAGMDFLGDDYVLVLPGEGPSVHALYATAKVDRGFLASRLPEFGGSVVAAWGSDADKDVVLLRGAVARRVAASARLAAIAIPEVSSDAAGRLAPASGGDVLRALAPTTLFQLAGAGAAELRGMAGLVRSLPGWRLGLGDDPHAIVAMVRDLAADGVVSEASTSGAALVGPVEGA